MPEQPYFSVDVNIHGSLDQSAGEVPDWCDLTVIVNTDPPGSVVEPWAFKTADGGIRLCVTRAAGQAMIDAVYEVLHPWAGRSIGEVMKRQLDEVVERLMTDQAEEGDKYLARGMAMAIACLHAPLNPDWESIRDEAVARYHDREE